MGENFLQMLMGMVDSYVVAHLGLIAISGVSVAGNIITIYQAIFLALGAAVGAVVCLFYASMKTSEAKGAAQNAEAEPESENTK